MTPSDTPRDSPSDGSPGISAEDTLAEALLLDEAEIGRYQVRQTTSVYPDMTMDDAYRVQAAWLERKLGRGESLVGHKIGLTSRAMQSAMKIDTPDSGFLTQDMVFQPNSSIEAGTWCDLKLEIELGFVLKTDLVGQHSARQNAAGHNTAGQNTAGHEIDVDDVLAATDYVTPAIELIAARSFRTDPESGRTRTVVDTISDNAADAGIVCGGTKVMPGSIDLRWISALGYRNGVIEETGVAAGVLDHPARGIVWLARRYAEQGLTLEAGQTILSGSFTRPIDVRPGDEFHFDYGDLGNFNLSFT